MSQLQNCFKVVLFLCALTAQGFASTPPTSCRTGIMPGLLKMTRGIDITSLDLAPNPAHLHLPNGFRAPLISLTCYENQIWINPTDGSRTHYTKPDQIAGLFANGRAVLPPKTLLSADTEEYKRARSKRLGLDFERGHFGQSVGLKEAMGSFYREDRSVAETTSSVSAISVDLYGPNRLKASPDFLAHLERCTAPYEKSPAVYDSLITTYGTHYFESATFGGLLYQRSALENEFLLNRNESEITTELETSFTSRVADATSGTTKTSPEAFQKHSTVQFYFFGGPSGVPVKAVDSAAFLEHWIPSVYKDPWLFSGKLRPIEHLISNETIRAEVTKAIAFHKANAYFRELKSLLEVSRYRLSDQLAKEQEKIEKRLEAKVSAELPYLIQRIDYLFERIEDFQAQRQVHSTLYALQAYHAKLLCHRQPFEQCGTESITRSYTDIVTRSEDLQNQLISIQHQPAAQFNQIRPLLKSVRALLGGFKANESGKLESYPATFIACWIDKADAVYECLGKAKAKYYYYKM